MRGAIGLFLLWVSAGGAWADSAALKALNDYRQSQGRSPLTYSTELESAAQAHAADMARAGFFDHTGSDGSDVATRVSRQGYGWCVVAENIAKGQQSLSEVMRAWAGSEGHNRNMLSREVTEFALIQEREHIWVMVLAAPGC